MLSVTVYGGVNEIGGNKIMVENSETRVMLDFGRSMGYFNEFFDEFLQPRSKSGIRDYVKLGILPGLDGIYRDFFVKTFSDFPIENALDEVTIHRAEDYWRSRLKSYDEYAENNDKPYLDAVLVSHAHFDHIQDISYLSPKIPVYCTEETRLLVKVITDVSKSGSDYEFFEYYDYEIGLKGENYRTLFPGSPEVNRIKHEDTILKKHDFLDIEFTQRKVRAKERDYRIMRYGEELRLGKIKIKTLETDHSVPGSCAFILEEEKNILYTGDIRFHGDEKKTLDHFLKQIDTKIDIMIIEGTRVDSERMVTEKDVENDLKNIFKSVKKLIFVDFPWKDLQRFNTVLEASKENGRTLVVDPKLAYMLFRFHLKYPSKYPDIRGLDNVVVYKRRQDSMLYSESDYKKIDAGYLPDWGRNKAMSDENILRIKEKVDQGIADQQEELAWKLAVDHIENGITAFEIRDDPERYVLMINFWRMNELFDLCDDENDLSGSHYVKCMCEPFNEEMQVDESKLINWLDHFGIGYDCKTDDGKRLIKRSHVSGHASRPELKEMIKRLKPEKMIPIHTTYPQEFVKLASEIESETGHPIEVIVPEQGDRYDL